VVYASANPDKSADYSGVAHACATQRFGVGNTLLQPQEHFVFGRVGVDRYLRAFENVQEPVLVAKQPSEQPIERGISRAGALEDPVETGAQELGLFHAGSKLVGLCHITK